MEEREKDAGTFDLLGRRTSLEFYDTADWHATDQPVEYLPSEAALVAWGQHVASCRLWLQVAPWPFRSGESTINQGRSTRT